jgi:hypothetical protein
MLLWSQCEYSNGDIDHQYNKFPLKKRKAKSIWSLIPRKQPIVSLSLACLEKQQRFILRTKRNHKQIVRV